jgi:hypothetical protein
MKGISNTSSSDPREQWIKTQITFQSTIIPTPSVTLGPAHRNISLTGKKSWRQRELIWIARIVLVFRVFLRNLHRIPTSTTTLGGFVARITPCIFTTQLAVIFTAVC